MLGSENHFFKQSKKDLIIKRNEVYGLLRIKGYSKEACNIYLKAYNHFIINPNQFDGATLVNDLCDLPGLDLDAMLHDFHYLMYNVASNISMKWRADKLYAKGNERKGKGKYSAYSRFIGLSLSGIGFIPFSRIKRGKMTNEQKEAFMCDYRVLN